VTVNNKISNTKPKPYSNRMALRICAP